MDIDAMEYLETTYNIFINIEDLTYSKIGYEGIDFRELPEEWLEEVNFF